MIDIPAVFAAMDQAVATRGLSIEDGREHPEAFGSRWRLYRRTPREALMLTWDGKEEWLTVSGGVPWRELARVQVERSRGYEPRSLVATLLGEAASVPDCDP